MGHISQSADFERIAELHKRIERVCQELQFRLIEFTVEEVFDIDGDRIPEITIELSQYPAREKE